MMKRIWYFPKFHIPDDRHRIDLIGILIAIPTGYEDALIYQDMERAVGEVTEVNNSAVKSSGLIQSRGTVLYHEIRTACSRGRK